MPPSQSTQTALLLNEKYGDLVLSTVPVPAPGKDEVLVKIYAAALNPADWKVQRYGFLLESFPAILGTDIAGEIVELGEGVGPGFKVGDQVFFQGLYGGTNHAGFQQYTLADVHTLGKIPPNVSCDEAATIPAALTAAYTGLYSARPGGLGYQPPISESGRGKYAGIPVLVVGGSSSVGQYAIQLAKLSGFGPIVTTSSLKHESFLKSLGATHVMDRKVPPTKANVEAISGVSMQLAFDAIASSQTQSDALNVLGSGGEVVAVGPIEDATKERAAAQQTDVLFTLGMKTLPSHVGLLRELWSQARRLLETGDIKPNRIKVLGGGLRGVIEGLDELAENKVSGVKLITRPQETLNK